MNEDPKCYTCRWGWGFIKDYEGDVSDLTGSCHRHAPKPAMWNHELVKNGILWPPVEGDDGCGDWTSLFT
jgi:hypothetical protein